MVIYAYTQTCVLCAVPQPSEESRSPKRVKESPRENTEPDIEIEPIIKTIALSLNVGPLKRFDSESSVGDLRYAFDPRFEIDYNAPSPDMVESVNENITTVNEDIFALGRR